MQKSHTERVGTARWPQRPLANQVFSPSAWTDRSVGGLPRKTSSTTGRAAIGTDSAPAYCKAAKLTGLGTPYLYRAPVVTLRAKRHKLSSQGKGPSMRLPFAIRAALIALLLTGAGLAPAAYADNGSIRFNVVKAGFIVGGSGGTGTLVFHGRRYALGIGGVSWGFTFGASATDFVGTVSNIRRPSDVNGVYGAAGAGAAIGRGGGAIVLTNQNGAVLALSGRQAGLIVAADLNGLVISLR